MQKIKEVNHYKYKYSQRLKQLMPRKKKLITTNINILYCYIPASAKGGERIRIHTTTRLTISNIRDCYGALSNVCGEDDL